MSSITIKFRDGTVKEFKHQGRPGGSYTKTVSYEGSFVIITDEWYEKTSFPADIIAEVIETPNERW